MYEFHVLELWDEEIYVKKIIKCSCIRKPEIQPCWDSNPDTMQYQCNTLTNRASNLGTATVLSGASLNFSVTSKQCTLPFTLI